MKLKFLFDNLKRDLKTLPVDEKGYVSVESMKRVIDRWEGAFSSTEQLKVEELRFQELLYLDRKLTRDEFKEVQHLLMMIHMPIIDGRNDVIGVRIRDSDYYRLINKLAGRPLEDGIDGYNQAQELMLKERKQAKEREEAERKAQARKRKEEENRAEEERLKRILSDMK